MTKKSRTTQATPDDTEVELASSPCQINEVDPAYMGLDVPEEAAGGEATLPARQEARQQEAEPAAQLI